MTNRERFFRCALGEKIDRSPYMFYFGPWGETLRDLMGVDITHIWEDMSGKQGSLISPDLIREFMLPNYRRFREFADRHNIPIVVVDTDGDCEELIPLFYQGGVNMMMPFEATGGSDVCRLRKKNPYMAMRGGIDKQEIGRGRAGIDRELERIRPLLNTPGYFPGLDHLIPPEVTFDDYCYFIHRLRELIFDVR